MIFFALFDTKLVRTLNVSWLMNDSYSSALRWHREQCTLYTQLAIKIIGNGMVHCWCLGDAGCEKGDAGCVKGDPVGDKSD